MTAPTPAPTTPATLRGRTTMIIASMGIVLAAVLGVAVGALLWRSSSDATAEASPPPATNLFVIDAESGWATPGDAGTWQLHLVAPSVMWFRDRPARGAGTETMATLVGDWSANFPTSPNAAVLAPDGPQGSHPTAVELSDPAFDATTHTATITMVSEPGQTAADSAWLDQLTEDTAPTNGRVILFVDDASTVSDAAGQVTLSYVQGVQFVTVPDGVSTAHIVASGGAGGDGDAGQHDASVHGGYGGEAAQVTGDLAVTPGDTIQVYVGQRGADGAVYQAPTTDTAGGVGGWGFYVGGNSGTTDYEAGGGGGATVVTDSSVGIVLVAAGGGGGGAQSGCDAGECGGGGGGSAGATPADGNDGHDLGHGNGGAAAYTDDGDGGDGGSGGADGGGGGGGVKGGGGGNHGNGGGGGGGGAGSSTTGTLTNASIDNPPLKGDGLVTITWS